MTVAKLKTSAAFLALALGAVLAIAQIGCLTPETKAQIVTLQSNLDRGQATVLQLKTELEKYRGDMAAVVADVKAGKVPLASGLKLADEIMANMTATQQRLADALAVVDSTRATIQDMQKGGAPWYAYAIPAGLTLAQLLGTFVPQLSFLVPVAGALKGQLAGAQTKLATTTEIAGSLSRTLDGLAPKESAPGAAYAKEGVGAVEPPLAQLKQELLLREQQADELATKADYDELRRMAQAGQI